MTRQIETGAITRHLLRLMVPTALGLWAFVATGTTSNFSAALEGHYSSSGEVLLSNGSVLKVHQSLAFHDARFYALTRNAPAVAEASGRVETDLRGRTRLVVEQGSITGLEAAGELDNELVFNLFYGKHQGARITLEQVGACLYGVETQQVYCAASQPGSL